MDWADHARVHKGIFCTRFRTGQFKQNLDFQTAGRIHSPLSLEVLEHADKAASEKKKKKKESDRHTMV